MNAIVKIGDSEYEPARLDRAGIIALAESGVLERFGRVEVIDGVLVQMSPSYRPHGDALFSISAALGSALPSTLKGSADAMILFGDHGMRSPDISIYERAVAGNILKPTDICLAIEIADSSLAYDLGDKAMFYAEHSIPDYWVIDLLNKRLIIHRDPSVEGYKSVTEQPWSQVASPLIAPGAQMVLADVLAD